MRIAFICGNLARYNVELLHCITKISDIHVTVLQMVEHDRFRKWRYSLEGLDVKTIDGIHIPLETNVAGPDTYHIPIGLIRELQQGDYDALLSVSWTQGYTLLTLATAKMLRLPVLLFEESIPHKITIWKRIAMPAIHRIMRSYDGCVVGSSKCKEYMISLGCQRERIHVVRHPVDLERFGQSLTPSEKLALRCALGLTDESPVVLFVGQFIKRKGVIELLEAWHQIQAREKIGAILVLTGSGELEPFIHQFIATHRLQDTVRVNPYLQEDELRKWYGAADMFVMPSRYDAFGVVAGEAMASGLPVITTRAVGAEPDLVQDEVSGIVIPPKDVSALKEAIQRLIMDAQLRERMSHRARESVARYVTHDITSDFVEAIKNVTLEYSRRKGRGNSL